ncbi:exonuclease domain-containing protein [Actinoplanes campanulatus]|uniref:exonuclease domain-containing protein n=1 Tax=Actinoplanes campanulatus TaxID=113559 RepID=UPI0019530942|nr:exonuclease domain-containing protein [Actinoplanes capillaceus]
MRYLIEVHRETFAIARPRIAVASALPDRQAVYRHYEQHALRGIGVFDRAGRARARQLASQHTEHWLASQWAENESHRVAQQAGFDDQWRRLTGNDTDTVLGVLSARFEAVPGYAPVGTVSVDGNRVGLALTAAADSVVPAGLTGGQRARVYESMLKSHALAAVKQAFASAPGLMLARVVVVRHDARRPCVLALEVSRPALESVRWDTTGADEILASAGSMVLTRPEGPFGDLGPVDDLLDDISAELAAGARGAIADMVARQEVEEPEAGAAGFAIVDVETSGLSPEYDRVVEVAVVGTDRYGNVVDEWTTLVNPDGPVGKTSIHRIRAADVADAPRFADIVGELTARLVGRVIVGHNVQFDLRFLHAEYARARLRLPRVVSLCTYQESHGYLPDLDRRRLADCCHAAGVALTDAHAALEDARATAGLLRTYLGSGSRLAGVHRRLPEQAAQIGWPRVPVTGARIKARQPAAPPPVPAQAGALAALLEDLPVADVLPNGAPPAAAGYVELLAEALEDGVLTQEEATALADHARFAGLSRADVDSAHHGFVLALAHQAVADGRVTNEERRELNNAAEILGLPNGMVKRLLAEADSEWVTQLSRGCSPLPEGWAHGEPLRVGQKVAFTGGEPTRRERLEIAARAAGLRVMNNVSRVTAILVTPEAQPNSGKGEAARKHGTRIVRPGVFEQLVEHVQPAPPVLVVREATADGADVSASAAVLGPALGVPVPPAVVRAWARENGYVVGPRGRLPQEVQAAFLAANATTT